MTSKPCPSVQPATRSPNEPACRFAPPAAPKATHRSTLSSLPAVTNARAAVHVAQLNAGRADAARTCVQQHAFTRRKARLDEQIQVGRGEHFGQSRRLFERQPFRNTQRLPRRNVHEFGIPTARQQRTHAIADPVRCDAFADSNHLRRRIRDRGSDSRRAAADKRRRVARDRHD